mgnify:CR=1 FL=1
MEREGYGVARIKWDKATTKCWRKGVQRSGWVVGGFDDFVVVTPRQKVAGRNKGCMEKHWWKRRGSPERRKGMPLMETHQHQYKLNDFKIV